MIEEVARTEKAGGTDGSSYQLWRGPNGRWLSKFEQVFGNAEIDRRPARPIGRKKAVICADGLTDGLMTDGLVTPADAVLQQRRGRASEINVSELQIANVILGSGVQWH
ncbi:MAG: hypothetical protein EOR16_31915 [Mesorhizobium sp.]|uniref:hypothetical protein n=1 Tax=Mesorhizobium sp. TaxID=1871066 RepID=UPI000FE4E6DD|nr:hypothetical protein [Mesorhizobium sp.]RWI49115.1 MAG: hypothetical protein EOR16_31915 [Mesorhizobium sp.]